jgi:hypothetical protein
MNKSYLTTLLLFLFVLVSPLSLFGQDDARSEAAEARARELVTGESEDVSPRPAVIPNNDPPIEPPAEIDSEPTTEPVADPNSDTDTEAAVEPSIDTEDEPVTLTDPVHTPEDPDVVKSVYFQGAFGLRGEIESEGLLYMHIDGSVGFPLDDETIIGIGYGFSFFEDRLVYSGGIELGNWFLRQAIYGANEDIENSIDLAILGIVAWFIPNTIELNHWIQPDLNITIKVQPPGLYSG